MTELVGCSKTEMLLKGKITFYKKLDIIISDTIDPNVNLLKILADGLTDQLSDKLGKIYVTELEVVESEQTV